MPFVRRRFVVACGCLALLAPQTLEAATAGASVTLSWTAPGDDGNSGTAQAYILRYSIAPLTPTNFPGGTLVTGVHAPKPPGTPETFRVMGLTAGTRYYFGIISTDDGGNWSLLSNLASTLAQTTGVGDVPLNFEFATPRPNPARHSTHIAFTMPEGAFAQVEVFDVAGRFCRTLVRGWRDAGRTELEWDLRDDSGTPVSAGVYLVRARLGASAWTKRLVVTR